MSEEAMSRETLYIICTGVGFLILMTIMYLLLNSKINTVKSEVERDCLDMRTIVNKQNQILDNVLRGFGGARAPAPRPPLPSQKPTLRPLKPELPSNPSPPVCSVDDEECPRIEEISNEELDQAVRDELNNVELETIANEDVDIELDDI